MFNFKWQEQAVYKQRVAVVAPRGYGKSIAAMQWARRAGKEVLYLASNRAIIPYIIRTLSEMFPTDMHSVRPSHGVISWNDGTVIHVLGGRDERAMRGYRADAVVIDDADYIHSNAVRSAMMCCTGERMFITCSSTARNAGQLLERFPQVERMIIPDTNGKNASYKFLLESAY